MIIYYYMPIINIIIICVHLVACVWMMDDYRTMVDVGGME